MLIWGGEVSLPALAATTLKRVATASLFIYLTHLSVVFVLRWGTQFEHWIGQPTTTVVALVGAFALGVGLKAIFDLLDQKIQAMDALRLSLHPREKDEGQA